MIIQLSHFCRIDVFEWSQRVAFLAKELASAKAFAVVERRLAKAKVAGSIPVSRLFFFMRSPVFPGSSFLLFTEIVSLANVERMMVMTYNK